MIALTRPVSASINRCELTHLDRQAIDLERARAQHVAYERALESAGCRVVRLEEADDLPDSVFVEDTAVVLDEFAVIMRPGAESRRPETSRVSDLLRRYRTVREIQPPATIDGGDVLVAGRHMFIGQTARTNAEGVRQMETLVAPFDYVVRPVVVSGCLHLKSAVTAIAANCLLLNPAWVSRDVFPLFDIVEVDPQEPSAANVVRVGEELIHSAGFPRTRARIERFGLPVHAVDMSELAKAEGAVTCCSLIVPVHPETTKS